MSKWVLSTNLPFKSLIDSLLRTKRIVSALTLILFTFSLFSFRSYATSLIQGFFIAVMKVRGYQGLVLDTPGLGLLLTQTIESSSPLTIRSIDIGREGGQTYHREFPVEKLLTFPDPVELITVAGDAEEVRYAINATIPHSAIILCLIASILTAALISLILQLLKLQIEQGERLASAERIQILSNQVAHDIRSPLAALKIIESESRHFPGELNTLLNGAIQRIHAITEDLIKPSQSPDQGAANHQTESPEPTNLRRLIETVLQEKRIEYSQRQNIEIIFQAQDKLNDDLGQVPPRSIPRILSNLINNSFEATPGGGKILVELLPIDQLFLELRIQDWGNGIPKEKIKTLFQRGATFGKAGGSGLGLWHARKVCEAAGIRLDLESEEGIGTRVTLRIPRAKKA